MPDDLEGVIACVSPGVALVSGFDDAIAKRGIDVHMVDASVDGPAVSHPRFHFRKLYIGPSTEDNFISLEDLCRSIPQFETNGDLILLMDIEGAEYVVILGMPEDLLSRFRIIIIEFHNLESIFHKFSFELMNAAFAKLLRHHKAVHLHPNNIGGSVTCFGQIVPCVMEMTFYRKDRAEFNRDRERHYPHPLDKDNGLLMAPLILPPEWR